jgi:PKD repeat protein
MLEAEYTEGRLLVRFKKQSETELVQTLASCKFSEWGVRLRHAYIRELAGLYLVEGDFLVHELLPAVLEDPDVLYAEPDYKIKLTYQPNDPYSQSGTDDAYHLDKIHAFEAWDHTKGSPSLVIANTDAGTNYNHEDLAANVWTNAAEASGTPGVDDDGNGYVDDLHGWNFVKNNHNIIGGADIFTGHGTLTSSLHCGVGHNGKGIAGVSYNCKFAVLYMVDTTAAAIESFQYCVTMGFKIVNASWVVGVNNSGLRDAITEMNNNGILLVTTAGNDGINLGIYKLYPVCYTHQNIIGVMSTNQNGQVPYWSSWGATAVDLAAPGADIRCADPAGGYRTESGTSFSCPLVTGAIALLWSKYPGKTHLEIKQLLLDNVDILSSLSGKCVTGGRLNIKEALEAGGPTPPKPEAGFSGSPTSGESPLTVSFTDETSGQVTSWQWDFGDVSVSDQQNPVHTYYGAGTYTVSLTATGPGGSDTETKTSYIEVLPSSSVIANFTAIPRSGSPPLTVQFTDQSQGDITSWLWAFGDGSTSSDTNPTHIYDASGTYTVSLTVSSSTDNDSETKIAYITVGDSGAGQKKSGGGCAIIDTSQSDNPADMAGCVMPVLLLVAGLAVARRCKRQDNHRERCNRG